MLENEWVDRMGKDHYQHTVTEPESHFEDLIDDIVIEDEDLIITHVTDPTVDLNAEMPEVPRRKQGSHRTRPRWELGQRSQESPHHQKEKYQARASHQSHQTK